MKTHGWALLLLFLLARPAPAQMAATSIHATVPSPNGCSYMDCGFGISPTWNGLDVVSGASGGRVASLGFFWPHRVDALFAGNDSATAYASRAFRERRSAAVFTDVGVLLLGHAAARQASGGLHGGDRVVAALGVGAFAIGVPLQFSADGLLSRAVWWHNASLDTGR